MAEQISKGHAKSAGIVGILILILSLAIIICGIVWSSYGGKDAQGIWSGLLVSLVMELEAKHSHSKFIKKLCHSTC